MSTATSHVGGPILARVVVPVRLALICRGSETLAYNPGLNTWERLHEDTAEVLRWLRSKRDRNDLHGHLERRFGLLPGAARERLQQILSWCILRRLLFLDRQLEEPSPIASTPKRALSTVYWICTQACNLRCTYCYQNAKVARSNELTMAEGKDLVDQAVEAGAQVFIFTGGEPFARRDLLRIAGYSRDRGMVTNVITNGHYITKDTVAAIADVFDTVTISVDHGVPEHHDRNRGAGSWARAVNAVDLLLDADVEVDVNSVLARYGLSDVKELLRFGCNRPISQHRITPQFPMGRGAAEREDELTPRELLGLNEQLYCANQELKDGGETKLRTEGTYTKRMSIRNHCGAGLSEVSVDPEGWVYPCKLLQYDQFRTENVRRKRLASICDEHPVLQAVRGNVVDTMHPCKTCIIKNHCGGGCRGIHFSFTHEYTQAHPLFCAFLRNSFESQAWESTGILPAPRRAGFLCSEELLLPSQFVPVSARQLQ